MTKVDEFGAGFPESFFFGWQIFFCCLLFVVGFEGI